MRCILYWLFKYLLLRFSEKRRFASVPKLIKLNHNVLITGVSNGHILFKNRCMGSMGVKDTWHFDGITLGALNAGNCLHSSRSKLRDCSLSARTFIRNGDSNKWTKWSFWLQDSSMLHKYDIIFQSIFQTNKTPRTKTNKNILSKYMLLPCF